MLNKLKLDEGLGHYIPIKQVYLYLAGILIQFESLILK
jgi:hypothetical protein